MLQSTNLAQMWMLFVFKNCKINARRDVYTSGCAKRELDLWLDSLKYFLSPSSDTANKVKFPPKMNRFCNHKKKSYEVRLIKKK